MNGSVQPPGLGDGDSKRLLQPPQHLMHLLVGDSFCFINFESKP